MLNVTSVLLPVPVGIRLSRKALRGVLGGQVLRMTSAPGTRTISFSNPCNTQAHVNVENLNRCQSKTQNHVTKLKTYKYAKVEYLNTQ